MRLVELNCAQYYELLGLLPNLYVLHDTYLLLYDHNISLLLHPLNM